MGKNMRTNFTFYEASYKWSELTDEEKEFYYDKLLDEQKDIIARSRELERKFEVLETSIDKEAKKTQQTNTLIGNANFPEYINRG